MHARMHRGLPLAPCPPACARSATPCVRVLKCPTGANRNTNRRRRYIPGANQVLLPWETTADEDSMIAKLRSGEIDALALVGTRNILTIYMCVCVYILWHPFCGTHSVAPNPSLTSHIPTIYVYVYILCGTQPKFDPSSSMGEVEALALVGSVFCC
jgi:hypothetical protein